MKYYVVSDTHGYYSILIQTLIEKGFFEDKEPHKLVICGDLMDRGDEAIEMQNFILDLMKKDEVILIRGNHEDLALDLIEGAPLYFESEARAFYSHHGHNGTVDTFRQLTDMTLPSIVVNVEKFMVRANNTHYVKTIIPAMRDYFETEHYIFVHGWIPCEQANNPYVGKCYLYDPDWRKASEEQWVMARWYNGMICHAQGVLEDGKTIVCGHYDCSYGHTMYEANGGKEDFTPYYNEGIIAIDACTAYSKKMNCIVIED